MLGVTVYFVILTNFYSILLEHKAPDNNVNTRLLLWPVNKSNERQTQLCKYFLTAPKNSPSAERWSEHLLFERRAEFRIVNNL